MLRTQGDFALQAHFAQCPIHLSQPVAPCRNKDVGQPHILVQADGGLSGQRMAVSHRTHVIAYSPTALALRERVTAFMDAHMYPAEALFEQQVAQGDRWQPTAILAKDNGLTRYCAAKFVLLSP